MYTDSKELWVPFFTACFWNNNTNTNFLWATCHHEGMCSKNNSVKTSKKQHEVVRFWKKQITWGIVHIETYKVDLALGPRSLVLKVKSLTIKVGNMVLGGYCQGYQYLICSYWFLLSDWIHVRFFWTKHLTAAPHRFRLSSMSASAQSLLGDDSGALYELKLESFHGCAWRTGFEKYHFQPVVFTCSCEFHWLFISLIRTHDKLTCQMEIQLLLDEKVLWTQTIGEMETNMALNYSVLLRSPSPDATVQVWFCQSGVMFLNRAGLVQFCFSIWLHIHTSPLQGDFHTSAEAWLGRDGPNSDWLMLLEACWDWSFGQGCWTAKKKGWRCP